MPPPPKTQLDVDLDLGVTYTWRVDVEANDVTYEGQLQEFTTSKGLVAYYTFDEKLLDLQRRLRIRRPSHWQSRRFPMKTSRSAPEPSRLTTMVPVPIC